MNVIRQKLIQLLRPRGNGKPSECLFCTNHSGYAITNCDSDAQIFVCGDHIGDVITTWTVAVETTVVRL